MGVVTGTFQFPDGTPVDNGVYQWKLSGDAINLATAACTVPIIINGTLDASGNLLTTVAFNDVLSTNFGLTTFYQLTVKDEGGGQVWNENYQLTGSAANLNTIPPAGSVISAIPTTGPILLQVNGVTSADQLTLNAAQGTGMSITDNGVGTWTFAATASAAGAPAFTTAGQGGFISCGIVPNISGVLGVGAPAQINPSFQRSAGEVDVWQFSLFGTYVIRRASIFVSPGSVFTVTGTVGCGIYSADGTTKLVDSGAFVVSQTAGPVLSNTITAVTLAAGVYKYAETNSNNAQSGGIGVMGQACTSQLLAADYAFLLNGAAARIGSAANTSTAGALPTSLGSITAFTATTSAGIRNMTYCFFEP